MDLETAVRSQPDDHVSREALWSSLLDDGEYDDAGRHLAMLVAARRDEPYRVLHLLEIHAACGGTADGLEKLRSDLGLVFETEAISAELASERLARRAPPLADQIDLLRDELDGSDVEWFEGDLHVPHLDLCERPPLVVTGSLHVTGALLDGSHPLSSLTVLGSLFASNAVTRGELVIGGDVRITNLWYLNSGNDYTVHIAGDVHAAVFYEDGMRTTIGGTLTGAAASLHNEVTTRAGKLARGTVDPQCFAEDVLDEDAPAVEKLVLAARLERALLRRS